MYEYFYLVVVLLVDSCPCLSLEKTEYNRIQMFQPSSPPPTFDKIQVIFSFLIDFSPVLYESLNEKSDFEWPSDLFGQILPGF